MADIVRVTIVPRFVSSLNVTAENGYKLYGMSTGESFETNTSSLGKVKIDSVSGKDLFKLWGIEAATSWSISNPDNQAFSFTFSGGAPLYIGYDTQRGLLLGGKLEGGNAGAYADIGLKLEDNGSNSRNHLDSDTYVTYSDGRTELTNSVRSNGSGGYNAFYRGPDGKLKVSNQPYMSPDAILYGRNYIPSRCFLADTEILISDNSKKKISQIELGDSVACYVPGRKLGALESRKVTKLFRNVADRIIDLRGLLCTPGHVFLSCTESDPDIFFFDTIGGILRSDNLIVEHDEKIIRARTGARFNTISDALVAVVYRGNSSSGELGSEHHALVRGGIPIPATTQGDGLVGAVTSTLAWHLEKHGITLLTEGSLRMPDGTHHAACKWPEGSTPFDTHEARNWIVEVDGQPYTPPWIRDLVEENEQQGLRVVGALPTAGGTAASSRTL